MIKVIARAAISGLVFCLMAPWSAADQTASESPNLPTFQAQLDVSTVALESGVAATSIIDRQAIEALNVLSAAELLRHAAGVYVLSREFFAGLPDVGDHEDELFLKLAGKGKLFGFRSKTYWKAIDTVKDLNEAAAQLSEASK